MIIVFNVKISDIRLVAYNRASYYQAGSRMDVFKYCLASYAAMLPLISKCFIYVETEGMSEREKELEEFIYSVFPKEKIVLNWKRNNCTKDWVKACDEILAVDDELIWLGCNDDHIFIDKDLTVIADGLEALKNDPDPMAIYYYSHWPEIIRTADHNKAQLVANGNAVRFDGWGCYDSIEVIKKERFKRYWFEQDHGDLILYKTDSLNVYREQIIAPTYCPTKEIVRHYDGYSHVADMSNICPPLIIPNGFFDRDIKIKYGYHTRDNACVNINPSHSFLYAFNPSGTDYRWSLEDIPLFWKDRITSIEEAPAIANSKTILHAMRNQNIINSSKIYMPGHAWFSNNSIPPENWFEKHFIKLEE
jgi:hypothetical protein